MQHPILKDIRSITIYSIIWLAITLFDFLFIYLSYNVDFASSLFSSLIFNLLFALIGIAIWYAVIYSFPDKIGVLNLIINHVTSATVLILVWVFTGGFLIKLLTTDHISDFFNKHFFWYFFAGVIYYSIFVLIYYLIIYNSNLKERKKNEDRLLSMVKEAELNMLKSQINPHFLFNSLNSISSLTITNPAKAQEMIIKLSDFLRYSISRNNNQKSPLYLELENIQRYLDIEKTRFGERLFYKPQFSEECANALLPVMILQPLFENAIKHGVYESTEPITLEATCSLESGYLIIILRNNFDPEAPSKKGEGIGLKNIRERLRLTYHTEGLLQTKKTTDTFEVKLLIPQVPIN